MTGAIAISDLEIEDMADDAINAICLIVQKKIGQDDGGIAAVHFSNPDERKAVETVIRRYLALEEMFAQRDAESHT